MLIERAFDFCWLLVRTININGTWLYVSRKRTNLVPWKIGPISYIIGNFKFKRDTCMFPHIMVICDELLRKLNFENGLFLKMCAVSIWKN